jgi:RimJ/RimL family protein N-acetyltransferase
MSLFEKGMPIFETKRLTLRQPVIEDLNTIYDLYNAPETQQFQTKHYYSKNQLLQYIVSQEMAFWNQEKIMWVLERKSDRAIVGMRILYHDGDDKYEIQGDTFKQFWRKGYTKEAYLAILSFISYHCDNHSLVYSKIQTLNYNAIRLIESMNFTKVNQFTENELSFYEYQILVRMDV